MTNFLPAGQVHQVSLVQFLLFLFCNSSTLHLATAAQSKYCHSWGRLEKLLGIANGRRFENVNHLCARKYRLDFFRWEIEGLRPAIASSGCREEKKHDANCQRQSTYANWTTNNTGTCSLWWNTIAEPWLERLSADDAAATDNLRERAQLPLVPPGWSNSGRRSFSLKILLSYTIKFVLSTRFFFVWSGSNQHNQRLSSYLKTTRVRGNLAVHHVSTCKYFTHTDALDLDNAKKNPQQLRDRFDWSSVARTILQTKSGQRSPLSSVMYSHLNTIIEHDRLC